MRKVIMIAGLALALGVLAPATALGKAGGTDRPVQGSGSGTTVLDLATLAFVTDATGVVSHLGQTTVHFERSAHTHRAEHLYRRRFPSPSPPRTATSCLAISAAVGRTSLREAPQARRPPRLPAAPGALRAPAEVSAARSPRRRSP